ncbi:sulfotransferase [Nonomuraea turkmeniaca]|uniref:Sulfotransferase n=2 Tax=Nonomuraea turkmeniaca TaxID=103838 RepID=A0A5S4FPI4_9ACTN|nr:sulfotransferase [Nonomuraea turkmeniaca]
MVRRSAASVASWPGARLLPRPVFVLSAPRSGSTLLRLILDSHSRVHAPHELPLGDIAVHVPAGVPTAALALLGHDQTTAEHLLWDRLLHEELGRSGCSVLVVKHPDHVLMWKRLAVCWPDARFVFLLRHPAAIVASWSEAFGHRPSEAAAHLRQFTAALSEARRALPGVTVRYEDLVADPVAEVERVCGHIGVEFEPGMLEYGRHEHGPLQLGLGDWSDMIRSGRIQPARPIPAALPEALIDAAADWGYATRDGHTPTLNPKDANASVADACVGNG